MRCPKTRLGGFVEKESWTDLLSLREDLPDDKNDGGFVNVYQEKVVYDTVFHQRRI